MEYENYGRFLYGDALFGAEHISNEEGDTSVDLMRYLPWYWQDIKEMKQLQKTVGTVFGRVKVQALSIIDQFFLETVTWGLKDWEKFFEIDTDIKKSDEFRRERIRAKLRGTGTTTKQLLINVASAFSNGEATVIEYPAEYRFVIKFIGVKGVPENIADLQRTIEEIKPAHMAFSFEYMYNYWDTLRDKSWDTASLYTWSQIKIV